MSDPFAKHGISHLSASSLALYRNEPALWCLKYLFGVKDEVGPAAWRGSAVEAGIDWYLYQGKGFYEKAEERFELDAQGDLSEEVEKERAALLDFLTSAVKEMFPHGRPVARQYKVEYRLEGIEVPIIGYVDYLYDDKLIDLKTTHRLPSEPRPDHACQVAVYAAATGKKPLIVYATPKKSATYEVADIEAALWPVIRSAHAVRALLATAKAKEDAARFFCPNLDSFYWSDATKQAALEVWR